MGLGGKGVGLGVWVRWEGVVWCGVVWSGVVWCGVVWEMHQTRVCCLLCLQGLVIENDLLELGFDGFRHMAGIDAASSADHRSMSTGGVGREGEGERPWQGQGKDRAGTRQGWGRDRQGKGQGRDGARQRQDGEGMEQGWGSDGARAQKR